MNASATTPTTLTLHGMTLSGHSHRVELLLRMLDLPFEFIPAPSGAAVAAFRARLNPMGQIPVLEDGELLLADSTAILVYLSKRYDKSGRWLPDDAVGAAAVQRWLSIASGEIANGPAALRANRLFDKPVDAARGAAITGRVLDFMDLHLRERDYLAAAHPTIADLACYGYVARAPDGGVSLDAYPAIRAWLARVEALPAFVPIPAASVHAVVPAAAAAPAKAPARANAAGPGAAS